MAADRRGPLAVVSPTAFSLSVLVYFIYLDTAEREAHNEHGVARLPITPRKLVRYLYIKITNVH